MFMQFNYFRILCVFNNFANLRLILKFKKFQQNFEQWYFRWIMHVLFDNSVMIKLIYSSCSAWWEKILKIIRCVRNFLRLSFLKCTIYVSFSDCLLWNLYKVNSYQVSLNWNDNLSYNLWWNVCSQFSDSCLFEFCQNVLQWHYILQFMILFEC